MMADWLFDGIDRGLGLKRQGRDLRDLWIDTFISYARLLRRLRPDHHALRRQPGAAEPARITRGTHEDHSERHRL